MPVTAPNNSSGLQQALPGGWDYSKNPIGPLNPYGGYWKGSGGDAGMGAWHPDIAGLPDPIQNGVLMSPEDYWKANYGLYQKLKDGSGSITPPESSAQSPPSSPTSGKLVPGGVGGTIDTVPQQTNQPSNTTPSATYNQLPSYNLNSLFQNPLLSSLFGAGIGAGSISNAFPSPSGGTGDYQQNFNYSQLPAYNKTGGYQYI